VFQQAIRSGVLVAVVTLGVCVLGIAAVLRVPIQMIPDMDVTTLTVVTRWPGATPQDVEREIAIEQEEYLRTVPGLRRMVAQATTGEATVELEFGLGIALADVLTLVNNALAQVPDYPPNVDKPRIYTTSWSDHEFMFLIVEPLPGNPQGVDIAMQHDFVEDHVKAALERTPGVAEAALAGGAERQVRVYVDPQALAARHLTLGALRDALLGRNTDVPGGDLDAGKRRYLVRTVGRYGDLPDVQDTVVAVRDGAPVHLRDVARVELTHAELRSHATFEGREVLLISIKKQRGTNVVEVERAVNETAARLNRAVLEPLGLRIHLMHSDVDYVRKAVRVVWENLAAGALLAALALALFLRSWRATLIGALAIPICTIAAFLGLLIGGRTINVVSLAGIAFAIGMTVDNNVVVLENIQRHRELGKGVAHAALDGVREVWSAVLASTATTVLVFLPLLLIREEAGQLYGDIGIAIAAAITVSMAVAVLVVPAASARWLGVLPPPRADRLARGAGTLGAWAGRVVDGLTASTARALACVAGVLAVSGAVLLWLTPRAEYLPEAEEANVFAMLFPPPGYNLPTMQRIGTEIDAEFVAHLGADGAAYAAGETDIPPLWRVMTVSSPDMVMMIGNPHDRGEVQALMDALGTRFARYPGMIGFSTRGSIFSDNQGGTRSMELDVSGQDLAAIFGVGFRAFLRAREVLGDPQILPKPSSLTLGQPVLEVRPDWVRAAEAGLSAEELGYLVWALADGAYHDDFYLADDKVDLYLYGTGGTLADPAQLAQLPLYTAAAGVVPLASVAAVRETVNTDTVRRVNGERTVTLQIVAPRDMPLETAVETVEREVIGAMREAGEVPPGVRLDIGGASDKLAATRAALVGNMLLASVLIYLVMVAVLRHWLYPLLIMGTVPIGAAGGIAGLALMQALGVRAPLDMITMLGFLVLIGIVVNNPILIVERARQSMAEGMDAAEAVADGVRMRLRPIAMTTLATMVGLAPLVVRPGEGTELYRGLGIVLLFGLGGSTLVTLTFTPALLVLVARLRGPWHPRPT
jgi:multidrug efflux pump subunit AcrB